MGLGWILGRLVGGGGGCGVDLPGWGQGPVAGSRDHDDEPLGFGAKGLLIQ